jgi:hypothetical protein
VTPTLTRTFTAGGTIGLNRVVIPGAADGAVVQAAAATGALIGVCRQPGGAVSGERCDVDVAGVTEVVAGGTITRGALLTSDANGAVIAATAAAGSNVRVIGIALVSAASGDIIPVLLAPGSFQG